MAKGAECSQGELGCVESDTATQTKASPAIKPLWSSGSSTWSQDPRACHRMLCIRGNSRPVPALIGP